MTSIEEAAASPGTVDYHFWKSPDGKIRFSLLPSCGSGQNTSSQASVEDFVSKLEAFIDEKYPQCSWMLTLNVLEMRFILLNV